MRILLVYPKTEKRSIFADSLFAGEPLALEYLAAGLQNHHDIKLYDMRFDHTTLPEVIEAFSPDVVGFTGYTYHVKAVKKLSQQVKNLSPGIVCVVGGHHATVSPHDYYIPSIDVVVRGEGVFTFNEIIERIEKKQNLAGIEGASVHTDGGFVENDPKLVMNVDQFPFPDRSLRHREKSDTRLEEVSSMITSQGCMFRCKFCSCWQATGGKYLTRDLHRIVEELGTIEQSNIHFADDETFIIPKRMMDLADLIDKAGIQKYYFSIIRPDTVLKYPELIEKWKRVGLRGLQIGMDAFKEEDLKYYDKKCTLEQNRQALHIIKDNGVGIVGNFIVRQDYDEKDFDNLADYALSLPLDVIFFSILTPLPGTQLYKEEKSNLISHDYELFDFLHTVLPTKLPIKSFYREFYHLLIKTTKNNVKGIANLVPDFGEVDVPPKFLSEGLHNIKHAYRDHEELVSAS